jgi:hypothetical protein
MWHSVTFVTPNVVQFIGLSNDGGRDGGVPAILFSRAILTFHRFGLASKLCLCHAIPRASRCWNTIAFGYFDVIVVPAALDNEPSALRLWIPQCLNWSWLLQILSNLHTAIAVPVKHPWTQGYIKRQFFGTSWRSCCGSTLYWQAGHSILIYVILSTFAAKAVQLGYLSPICLSIAQELKQRLFKSSFSWAVD